jgi:hypothetical protein
MRREAQQSRNLSFSSREDGNSHRTHFRNDVVFTLKTESIVEINSLRCRSSFIYAPYKIEVVTGHYALKLNFDNKIKFCRSPSEWNMRSNRHDLPTVPRFILLVKYDVNLNVLHPVVYH